MWHHTFESSTLIKNTEFIIMEHQTQWDSTQWFLPTIFCSSGVHCGKGRQQQCLAVSCLHQHQEQDELFICQPQRQRLLGPAHLRLLAANPWQFMGRHQPAVSDWSLGASFVYGSDWSQPKILINHRVWILSPIRNHLLKNKSVRICCHHEV